MKARMMSTQEAEVAQQHKRGDTIIKIVSASYGASAGRRLLNGEIISSSTGPANAPYTRDVAPFIRALLKIHQYEEKIKHDQKLTAEESIPAIGFNQNDIDDDDVIRLESASSMFLPLMDDGKSMNAIFGDPCPGTSKQLRIHYVLQEAADDAISRAAASEVHRIEFSEHERVVLRRRVTFYQDESKLKSAVAAAARKSSGTCSGMEIVDLDINNHDGEDTLQKARRLGRAQSISDFTEDPSVAFKRFKLTVPGMPHVSKETSDTVPVKKWRLRSATSEIVLPIVMPFLEVRERVQCQLVCKSWRFIVRYYGVANTVDINDASFPTSRSFLRGIMAHSYASLQSLFLNDFSELTKDDLHPAIPNLRKLRSLDISRCELLDNSTLKLISQHLSPLLEVLYMKGLKKVTDDGLISICQQCTKLKVLEISKLAITDESGIAIGEHLTRLRALYMRDNYLLTNRSVDTITKKCTKLNQLTLWGSTRLQHLSFEGLEWGTGNLVLLNIWGCHSLKDEAAQALAPMKSLRSLIASECHRLTDAFVLGLAENVPQLVHLQLRYCKRITDTSVNAVTNSMPYIYTLDLSFCTRITVSSLVNLLEIRKESLTELRLQNCGQLDISVDPEELDPNPNGGSAGRSILNTIRSDGDRCALNILDVRCCGGQPRMMEPFPSNHPFVGGNALGSV